MNPEIRVRFAPSPTGELHVGNARTALFNWLFARHFKGSLILRIEDTDEARSALSFQQNLIDDLAWLGLDWDEGPQKGGPYGPYRQSERLDVYKEHLKKLLDGNYIYPCYCTPEELEEERRTLILSKRMPRYQGKCRNLTEPERKTMEAQGRKPSWRFKVPEGTVEFNDLIRGAIRVEGEAIGDFIIVRSNGMPAYNFAVVIDDHLMNISHVIRGEDHISNTALQIMLYRAFGYEPPAFAHHCLILGADHAKLSKRHGSVSVGEFRKKGILPEALVNYLGLLGSSFAEGREVLSPAEMIEAFSLERASKSGAVFDEDKLRWLNGVHLRNRQASSLLDPLMPFLPQTAKDARRVDPDKWRQIVDLVKNDLTVLADIGDHVAPFLADSVRIDPDAAELLRQPDVLAVLEAFDQYLSQNEGNPQDLYTGGVSHVKKTLGVKGKGLFMPLRAALTGRTVGPELDRVFAVLGKTTARLRLQNACVLIRDAQSQNRLEP